MLDLDLIKVIILVALASSIVSTALIQKVKESINNKKTLSIMSIIISVLIGFVFSMSFSNLSWQSSLWVGLITYVGADAIYKTFEDKIFKSFGDMNKNVSVPVENKITFEEGEKNEVQ